MYNLHLYLSSKCPLHSSIRQTLKDKTRTRPLRALKSKEFIILVNIKYPKSKKSYGCGIVFYSRQSKHSGSIPRKACVACETYQEGVTPGQTHTHKQTDRRQTK